MTTSSYIFDRRSALDFREEKCQEQMWQVPASIYFFSVVLFEVCR